MCGISSFRECPKGSMEKTIEVPINADMCDARDWYEEVITMSYLSDIDIELCNQREDDKPLGVRAIIERDVANYWFERCLKAEAKLDELLK